MYRGTGIYRDGCEESVTKPYMTSAKIYDKFYTNDDVALSCWHNTINFLGLSADDNNLSIIEPSAGGGAFLRAFETTGFEKYLAYDIAPEAPGIIEQDFLALERPHDASICVGNPPFGRRSQLAVDFVNHAATFSDAIAFVLPVSFMKYSTQQLLSSDLKLVYSKHLEPNGFNVDGQPFRIRCVHQIWVRRDGVFDDNNYDDLRLLEAPPTARPDDFLIWQHNATEISRKYVDEDWEIAVYRQGYRDYSKRFHNPEDYAYVKRLVYETNIQFFFIKPLHDQARDIIEEMNFEELAMRNMTTPGFGKRDFVEMYTEIENRKKSNRE